MTKIALIGAGIMGRAAAETLIGAGHEVCAYDVAAAALERAAGLGAQTAPSPAKAFTGAEAALLFLPGPAQVEEALFGRDGLLTGLAAHGVVVDMSTSDPAVTRGLDERAQAMGVGLLDAPVLGRPGSVGAWALPVGGRVADLESVRPLLEPLAARIFHVGPCGAGQQVKLLNQMMFGAINAMTAEMMAVADKMGLAPKMIYEIITASQAGTVSNLFKELGGRIAEDSYDDPTFSVDLLIKDVHLAVEMAKNFGAPPILGRSVEFLNEMARAQGYGAQDTAVMWKSLRRLWEPSR